MPKSIEEIIAEADQAIAAEQAWELEKNQPTSREWIIQQLPGWKSWYLKRNQRRNYFRVTRIIPPGSEENRHQWRHRFQLWVRGLLLDEYIIDCDTFDYFYTSHEWQRGEQNDFIYAILKNSAP